MKHSPHVYAKAFIKVAEQTKTSESELIKNLIACVKKNGDAKNLGKIQEKILQEIHRSRKSHHWIIQTARELKSESRQNLQKLPGSKDTVDWQIKKELIAGVKITKDNSEELDLSLARRLEEMLQIN